LEIKDYFRIIWRRKWLVFLTTAATLAVVATGTFTAVPTFSATTLLRLASNTLGSNNYSDYVYVERLLNTYARVATSRPIQDELENRLSLDESPVVKAEILPDTELIQISVESTDPGLAAEAANTLAAILVEQSKELYSGGRKSTQAILSEQLALTEGELVQARSELERALAESPEDSQKIVDARQSIELQQEIYGTLLQQYEQARVREAIRENMISIVEPALPPLLPSRPRPLLNLILGTMTGLAAGLGLAFLVDYLDTSHNLTGRVESERVSDATGNQPRPAEEI
jgi:polysaccharide biosynthesis transport protein